MNKIILAGTVTDEPIFSHEVYGEKFYIFYLSSSRSSGTNDILPCIISEILMNGVRSGSQIMIEGNIRTRNVQVNEKRNLEITVFVKDVLPYEKDENYVELEGFLCKSPNYRETPSGRKITDLLIATNRQFTRKSDYIPVIVWGRQAIWSSFLQTGMKLEISGRLQSREYTKRLVDGTAEVRTAYELSSSRVDIVEESGESDENSN